VTVVLLAHQGGWDEILLVLTPLSLFAGLLWLANTRANRAVSERSDPADDRTDTSDDPDVDDR